MPRKSKEEIALIYKQMQEYICKELEAGDGKGIFKEDPWTRAEGIRDQDIRERPSYSSQWQHVFVLNEARSIEFVTAIPLQCKWDRIDFRVEYEVFA